MRKFRSLQEPIRLQDLLNSARSSSRAEKRIIIAAAASEPEANERGSSLISRRLHYRSFQSLFLTKRKGLWLCASERFRMRSGMPQGIVVMREWEDLRCAAYQSHV